MITPESHINDTFLIEKHAKTIPGIVLAMSAEIVSRETTEAQIALGRIAKRRETIPGLCGECFYFDEVRIEKLQALYLKGSTVKVAA